jgi:hypothetical protein
MKLLSSIIGISIYGLETQLRNYICSWSLPLYYYFQVLKQLVFNSIRIPFSKDYVDGGDFSVMDEFFNLSVIYDFNLTLDFHRVKETHQSYSPISEITLDEFMNTWYVLLDRYQHHPNLYAISVFNEYQGENAEFWNGLMKTVTLNIEQRYPERFRYIVGCPLWSGNCHDMQLGDLPFFDRINYGYHKYIFSSDEPYEADWDYSIGSHPEKIIIEEWGFKMIPQEIAWANRFISYLKEHNIINHFFWTLAYSGDTDGLFSDSDCFSINWEKYSIIKKLWSKQ